MQSIAEMIYIILPAFNEAQAIPRLLPAIRTCLAGYSYRIIVLDDGSTDQTGARIAKLQEQLPIDIITHEKNCGLGKTFEDLLLHVTRIAAPQDIIVHFDCDGTHDPGYITNLCNEIARGCDVVIASRFCPRGGQTGVPLWRRFLSLIANRILRVCIRIPGINDYSCSFRAYRAEMLQKTLLRYGTAVFSLRSFGFVCVAELLVYLHQAGARIIEIPFILHYERKTGPSKMNLSSTLIGYWMLIFRIRRSRGAIP